MRLGTYRGKFVTVEGKVKSDLVQSASKAEATKSLKALFPDCQHVETQVVEPSEGEANKAKAKAEAEANEKIKKDADEKKKRDKKSKAKTQKKKKGKSA